MKRVLVILSLLVSLTGAGQHYIQASIQQGSTPNSVDIMFLPNYTNSPTEIVNYLSLSISIPAASAPGVVPSLTMTGPFAGMTLVPAIPFKYLSGSDSVYSWVYSSGPSSMTWTSGVPFVGATITFTGGTGSSKVKLVDFINKGGGANSNTLYVIVTNKDPYDVANYSSLFYSLNGSNGSTTGIDGESDQYVQTSQLIFLSNFCPAPVSPNVFGIGTTSATITWNPVPGVIGYEIELSTNPTATGGTITTNLSYSPTIALTVGTTYYFHIRSICSPGNFSGWVRTDFATICPVSTLIITDSITPSAVKIKWEPVPAGGQGYQYAVTSGPGTPSPSSIINTLMDSVVVSGLIEGTTYYAQVRVNCSPGVYSQWINKQFTTTFPPCLAPGKITVSNSGGNAEISWPITPQAIGYEYAVITGSTPPTSGSSTTSNSAHKSGLESNTRYNVYVRTQCGPGRYSPWFSQSFNSSCFKPSPFLITNTPASGTAELGWRKINGAQRYEYAILNSLSTPRGTLNFTTDTTLEASNLVPGGKYYLYVRTHCAPSVLSEWSTLQFNTSGVQIKSNPSSRVISIVIFGAESTNEQIVVLDAIGRVIKKAKLLGNTIDIDMRQYAAGVYFVCYGKNKGFVTRVAFW